MNNIRNIESITEQELNAGIFGGITKGSWHEKYKDSAWVFLGGFPFELSEGDIICVMSQWGEIEDINLVRDKVTNKSKGFAFIKYEDNRSTILAVDNFNGMKLLGRTLRCDHVEEYKLPKEVREKEIEALEDNPDKRVDIGPGHAYKHMELEDGHDVVKGVDLWRTTKPDSENRKEDRRDRSPEKDRKHKKSKKEKEHKEKKSKYEKEKKHKSNGDGDSSSKDRDRAETESYRHVDSSSRTAVSAVSSSSNSNSMHNGVSSSRPLLTTSTLPPPFAAGAVASWRGNRDPAMASTGGGAGSGSGSGGLFLGKRGHESSGSATSGFLNNGASGSGGGGGVRRDHAPPSGIGGASRVR